MPISSKTDINQKLIRTTCYGVMNEEDFNSYIDDVWGDMRHYGFNELFDAREANWDKLDFSCILDLAKTTTKLSTIDPHSKLAWLVLEGKQKQLSDFFMSAKTLLSNKTRSLKTFNNEKEALEWLKS